MRKSKFESMIDEYSLKRLTEDEKSTFEGHCRNSPSCFEKIVERELRVHWSFDA